MNPKYYYGGIRRDRRKKKVTHHKKSVQTSHSYYKDMFSNLTLQTTKYDQQFD